MSRADQPKKYFGAIPARAIGDSRLTGTHFRLLACVALHDRMSDGGKGQGCWASLQTLSRKCGVHHTNASTALNELAHWGYLSVERQHKDQRRRVARVLYTSEDEVVVRSGDRLPGGKPRPETVIGPRANETGQIVCPAFENSEQSAGLRDRNIFRINGIEDIPQKRSERHSAEAGIEARNPNGVLAQIQRRLKSGDPINVRELQSIRDSVERILETSDAGGQTHGWADSILGVLERKVAA